MLKAALVALVLSSPPMRPTAADVALDQAVIINEVIADFPFVETSITWMPCGFENAWYDRRTGGITLCLELNDTPGPVFVAAHEAAHAVTIQLGVDVGPSHTALEDAADEIAALKLIELGQLDEVVNGAKWFMELQAQNQDARHSPHSARARKLLTLVHGAEGGSVYSQAYYAAVKAYWAAQLAPHHW